MDEVMDIIHYSIIVAAVLAGASALVGAYFSWKRNTTHITFDEYVRQTKKIDTCFKLAKFFGAIGLFLILTQITLLYTVS